MDIFIAPHFSQYFAESPVVLVDVGASGGVQPQWKRAGKYLRVIAFEPDVREYSRLAASANPQKTTYLNTALFSEKTRVGFYLAREQQRSSVFPPNMDFLRQFPDSESYETERVVELDADTLDNQLTGRGLSDIDFIKADAQGAELAILQGAEKLLRDSVFGLEIEVEFAPMYLGQPLFADVDQFVRPFGFELFDLRTVTWKRRHGINFGGPKGQLIFADALYFKTPDKTVELLARAGDGAKPKLLRCMATCLVYGYVDYMLALFESARNLLSLEEQTLVLKNAEASRRKWNRLPDFRGRWRAANMLHRASRALDPTYAGWSIGERNVGNVDS